MASNSSLQKFVDFLLATRQHVLTGPDVLINQATKYRTYLWPLMLKGLTAKQMIQAGTEIIDFVQLKTTSTFGFFNPTDTFDFTGTNSLTQLKVPWRFAKVYAVTYEHEIDLNQGSEADIFKRVKTAKAMEMEQSFWEGEEDALWADPNFDTMEGTLASSDVGQPLSLRCFITDDGAVPSGSNGGIAAGSSAWTSIMGVSPTTYPNWANQFETFDNTSQTTRRATFISAMDAMWLDVQYMTPATSEQYFSNTVMNKQQIIVNKATMTELIAIATSKSNVLTPKASGGVGGSNDLGWSQGNIVYHGIPTKYIGKLDFVDSTDGSGATPLYKARFINFNHIKPIFHSKHFRRRLPFDGGAKNPYAKVVLEDTWQNLWCANRREQGIVRAA